MSDDCQQQCRNEFHVYDQTVDVISCWESALSHLYSDVFADFHFERFPSISITDGNTLTPDFTAFFNEEYGIIGEVKRTFPEEEVPFNSTLQQIAGYDNEHSLATKRGNRVKPDVCDILLLISGSSAPQIGTRLNEKLTEEHIVSFDQNLVLMRYQYNTDATLSRYEFQRVTQLEDEFRDEIIPDHISLSGNVGESGSYGTMEVYPKHFTPVKAKRPICNDAPSEPYLATILWHKIFPQYLNEDDYRDWRNGNVQKQMKVNVTSTEVWNTLNEYMMSGEARKAWVVDTLDYLTEANLAKNDKVEYEISFRDLVRTVGEDNMQEATQLLQQTKELAYMFINRYCEYSDDSEERERSSQAGLADFM